MAAAVTQIPVTAQKAEPTSRVVFTQGGKGGTGKTAFCHHAGRVVCRT